jgi:hypothetical protein
MSEARDNRTGVLRHGAIAVAAAVVAGGVLASSAIATQDRLKGGSVVMQLRGSHGLKLKPSTLTLPITGGAIDPLDGSGTANVTGAIKARKGKVRAKVKITSVSFGANGGPGRISAKIDKHKASFGTLTGGSVARDGWGASITGVGAKLSGRGAKALDFRGVKAGRALGTVSATTVPATVAVVPGSGDMILSTSATGPFVSKLSSHCIDPLPTATPPGVAPIAPAKTTDLLGTTYDFPVSGGAVAPDTSDGELITAGGQAITKNTSALGPPLGNPAACASAAPPVGTALVSTNIGVDFAHNYLNSDALLPTGFTMRAPLADVDFSTGSRSVDPNTKALTITGATASLSYLAALTLNQFFPTESGDPNDDFAQGDLIGTVSVTGAKLR